MINVIATDPRKKGVRKITRRCSPFVSIFAVRSLIQHAGRQGTNNDRQDDRR